MKVKNLIEQLQKCDPELDVYGYNGLDEGGGEVWEARQTSKNFPYCKADPPEKLQNGDTYVLILVE